MKSDGACDDKHVLGCLPEQGLAISVPCTSVQKEAFASDQSSHLPLTVCARLQQRSAMKNARMTRWRAWFIFSLMRPGTVYACRRFTFGRIF